MQSEINLPSPTSDVQLLRDVAGFNDATGEMELRKTLDSGYVGINLESQAKWMMPFFHGARRRIPSKTPEMGAASAQYRMQLGESSFDYSAAMGTANAGIGSDATSGATSIAAAYASQAVSGKINVEQIYQARGWDNAMNLETISTLTRLFKLEEFSTIGGNRDAITVGTVTGTPSTTHVTPIFSNATWSVAVTALTKQGCLANTSSNSNVGETVISYSDVVTGASGCDFIDVSWPVVANAYGYKIYCNHAGAGGHGAAALYLVPVSQLNYAKTVSGSYFTTAGDAFATTTKTYVTVNRVQINAVVANTQPTAPTVDHSANANMYEGLLSWATKNTIYSQALPTNHINKDCGGLPLTVQATGIAEFDYIVQNQWDTNHTSPSLIMCSSNSVVSMSNKIASAGNNNQFRLDVYPDRNGITGGLYVNGYVNKFASDMIEMGKVIKIWAHPYLEDGTFLFISEDVPSETLPYSDTGKSFAYNVQIPYSWFRLASTDRSYPFSTYYTQTLECYWPNCQSAIQGVRVDS